MADTKMLAYTEKEILTETNTETETDIQTDTESDTESDTETYNFCSLITINFFFSSHHSLQDCLQDGR
jgi:hypothetical protein